MASIFYFLYNIFFSEIGWRISGKLKKLLRNFGNFFPGFIFIFLETFGKFGEFSKTFGKFTEIL